MSITNIQAALDAKLQTVVGLPPLQLENTRNIAVTGQSFTRATLMPSQTRQATAGVTGKDEYSGLYQIDVFVAQDGGTSAVNALADSLIAAFPRGTVLDSGGTQVQILGVSRMTGGRIEKFYSVPVVVRWFAIV